MPALTHTLALAAAAALVGFGTGYAYRAHLASVDEATQTATATTAQATTNTAAKASDRQTIQRLEAQLTNARDRADALQALINEDRDAQPPTDPGTVPTCRLPERLRDAINADLAGNP